MSTEIHHVPHVVRDEIVVLAPNEVDGAATRFFTWLLTEYRRWCDQV